MRVHGLLTTTALVAALLPAGVIASPAAAQTAVETACPSDVPSAGFADVGPGEVHAGSIDCAVWWGVASGVDDRHFAPAPAVTRGQAASLVATVVRRSGGRLPASPGDLLAGDEHSVHHYSLNRLAAVGVLAGSSGTSRPDETVTRGQLATLVVRAFEHRTGTQIAKAPNAFFDDAASVHEQSIDRAAAAGLLVGVDGWRFRPGDQVTRAQMATFVQRLLQAVTDTGQVTTSPARLRAASALSDFDSCESLLGQLKERGVAQVGPFGWTYGGSGFVEDTAGSPATGGSAPAPAPVGGGENGFGTPTNNQVRGVDEADVVKSDGRTVWSVLRGRLRAVDVSGPTPREVGSVPLEQGHAHDLLVAAGRALVLTTTYGGGDVHTSSSMPVGGQSTTVLTQIDVSDPAAMRVEAVTRVDGDRLAARMVGDVVRLVVRTGAPDLGFAFPQGPDDVHQTAQRNRLAVESSTIEQWLPTWELEDRRPGTRGTTRGALYGCDGLRHPPEHSGLGSINVLTVDLGEPPQPPTATGVLAGGDLVSASTGNLYVATTRWDRFAAERAGVPLTTEVHAFSLADPVTATYRGSGKVTGLLLNQFAMDEHAGHLRVASTTRPLWGAPSDEPAESLVTVLAVGDGALTEVGRVGGLGLGETVRGVRFAGEQGYVVTFRQTDPLYTLDLSDPAAPQVVGELKILGYSAYLHPLGEGMLLGVGQDADEEGMLRGTQVSLFDVSDPARPLRRHAIALGEGTSSEVEFDHKAFLWSPEHRTAVLPLSRVARDDSAGTISQWLGAVGVEVSEQDGLVTVGEVSHGEPSGEGDVRWPAIRRSFVVGGTLFTLSDLGLKGSDPETLADRSWVPFAE